MTFQEYEQKVIKTIEDVDGISDARIENVNGIKQLRLDVHWRTYSKDAFVITSRIEAIEGFDEIEKSEKLVLPQIIEEYREPPVYTVLSSWYRVLDYMHHAPPKNNDRERMEVTEEHSAFLTHLGQLTYDGIEDHIEMYLDFGGQPHKYVRCCGVLFMDITPANFFGKYSDFIQFMEKGVKQQYVSNDEESKPNSDRIIDELNTESR